MIYETTNLVQSCADEEVIRLDISVNKSLGVYELQSVQHLIRNHQNCFQGEFLVAIVEQIFQRRAEQINHKYVVVSF